LDADVGAAGDEEGVGMCGAEGGGVAEGDRLEKVLIARAEFDGVLVEGGEVGGDFGGVVERVDGAEGGGVDVEAGGEDGVVAGAAAEVAGEGAGEGVAGGGFVFFEVGGEGDDKAGRAEAALGAVVFDEGFLDGAEAGVAEGVGEAFDGEDVGGVETGA
jgi:hypothetical protein